MKHKGGLIVATAEHEHLCWGCGRICSQREYAENHGRCNDCAPDVDMEGELLRCPQCGCYAITDTSDGQKNCDNCKFRW